MQLSTVSRGFFSVVLALIGLILYADTSMYALAVADPATGRPAGCWVILNDVLGYYGDVDLRSIERFGSLAMIWDAFFFWGLFAFRALVRACAGRWNARGEFG